MSKLEINLTDEEFQAFLEKRGYKIEAIKCFMSENEYHNRVVFYDTVVEVAYKPSETNIEDLKGKEGYDIKEAHGSRNVYKRELALLLKKMILNYE